MDTLYILNNSVVISETLQTIIVFVEFSECILMYLLILIFLCTLECLNPYISSNIGKLSFILRLLHNIFLPSDEKTIPYVSFCLREVVFQRI